MKNIWIIGLGGVGGYFGGKLTRQLSRDYHISFIARGEHLEKIRAEGLILNTDKQQGTLCQPSLATDDMSACPSPDLVLLCVKSYALPRALEQLKPFVTENTVLLPLLNGIDIVQRCRKIINNGLILPACVYVTTYIEEPGVVTQKGSTGKIIFGPDPACPARDVSSLLFLFSQASIPFGYFDNPYTSIWGKYIFIAAFGLVTAGTGKTLGGILEDKDAVEQVKGVMGEILEIAKAKDIPLPINIIEQSLEKAAAFPHETKTSFQRDVEIPGKPNESELFGSTILRLGQSLSITTPVTEKLHSAIEALN